MDRPAAINTPQTLAWEPLDSLHILACPRVPVSSILHLLDGKQKWFEQFATNEKIEPCCRDMNAHDIEAWYSCPDDRDKGIPDIYKIYCSCGRCHVKFCVGANHPMAKNYSVQERPDLYDLRPFWEVR
jgi:hypothetical protein